jgi:hypothetical protein
LGDAADTGPGLIAAATAVTTLREVGLDPETGGKARDLMEVDRFTKEVIGVVMRGLVLVQIQVEAST